MVPEADRRETLNWERELIGMYMGEHPLVPYLSEIRRVVTHFSSNLGEAAHEEKVRVAGMVTAIRPYQTKNGKMMAWVTLEDLTGTIELVVFPRNWEKYQFALEVGGVILVEGKADAKATPSKVLVDDIRSEFKLTEPAQLTLQPQPPAPKSTPAASPRQPATAQKRAAEAPGLAGPKTSGSRTPADSDDEPPPPEDPPGWENYQANGAAFAVPDLQVHVTDLPEEKPPVDIKIENTPEPVPAPAQNQPVTPPVAVLTPKLPAAGLPTRLEDDHPPQMLTVILHPSGDPRARYPPHQPPAWHVHLILWQGPLCLPDFRGRARAPDRVPQ